MSNPKQDIKSLTGLFKSAEQAVNPLQGQMSLASIFKPGDQGGFIDVVNEYPWTLSPQGTKKDAPYAILKEFEFNEGQILSSVLRFAKAGWDSVVGQVGGIFGGGQFDSLEAYQWLFPKDKPTGFRYQLPFFSDVNFSVQSDPWKDIEGGARAAGVETARMVGGTGAADWVSKKIDQIGAAGKAGLDVLGGYPITSPTDKPKMWSSHQPRTFEIRFPLFNTFSPTDWLSNRDLCVLLINQNLYNKRDYVTALPPVFYEVLIPGQHYSYAACVNDITIYNRGNMRVLNSAGDKGKQPAVVPDSYEVSISLTDLTMPSKNLFQQINNPKVYTQVVKSE